MIHFTCDLCKQVEVTEHQTLLYRKQHDAATSILWDICDGCLEKIKEQLGSGRSWMPKPEGKRVTR